MKENFGNLESLKKLGESKKLTFTKAQLIDEELKNVDGESKKEVVDRMNKFFYELTKKNNSYKNIAVISHGASIKFYLSQFCIIDENFNFIYNDKILKINSPCVIRIKIKLLIFYKFIKKQEYSKKYSCLVHLKNIIKKIISYL